MVHGGGQAHYYSPHWDIKTKASQTSLVQVSLFKCPSAGIIMSLPATMYHVIVCCKRPIPVLNNVLQ